MSPETVIGIVLLCAGQVSIALLGFSGAEIAAALAHAVGRPGHATALRRSIRFWQAAARNAWLLSVLAALVGLVTLICAQRGGLSAFVAGASRQALAVTVGTALAALWLLPALRLAGAVERLTVDSGAGEPSGATAARPQIQAWLAYGLLLAALAWPLLSPGSGPGFRPVDWLLRGPAWLVVGGGALAIALYIGTSARSGRWTVSIAVAGLVGALAGLVEASYGFSITRMEPVAGGLTLAIGSCFAALVGLAAIGLPSLDRAPDGETEGPLGAASRIAAWAFPAVVLAILVLAVALVLVPMERVAG